MSYRLCPLSELSSRAMAAQWQYRATEVGDVGTDGDILNKTFDKWAEAGWELVNGQQITSWDGHNWHNTWTLFWRRPVQPEAPTTQ